jgi:predicted  nucleic acid-binding Zn-ribbon protein
MEEYLEESLDITNQKIINIEKDIAAVQDQISALTESLKETQRYLIKLAVNQQELTKRISQWPYIVVSKREEDSL